MRTLATMAAALAVVVVLPAAASAGPITYTCAFTAGNGSVSPAFRPVLGLPNGNIGTYQIAAGGSCVYAKETETPKRFFASLMSSGTYSVSNCNDGTLSDGIVPGASRLNSQSPSVPSVALNLTADIVGGHGRIRPGWIDAGGWGTGTLSMVPDPTRHRDCIHGPMDEFTPVITLQLVIP